jgi:hypothetical protein
MPTRQDRIDSWNDIRPQVRHVVREAGVRIGICLKWQAALRRSTPAEFPVSGDLVQPPRRAREELFSMAFIQV